jgi:hypothetical protein
VPLDFLPHRHVQLINPEMKHSMKFAALAALVACSIDAFAVTDPSNSFLPSFTGAHVGALELLEADVTFDAGADTFELHATTNGPIADSANAAYIFGFNRGGTANTPFVSIGEPGVSFNETVLLRSNGTGTVGTSAVASVVQGNDISATISAALLPSNGLAPADFTWALWSIDSSIAGLARNAEFLPDANIQVAAAVPEPTTNALMLAGLAAVGYAVWRRKALGRASETAVFG